MPRLLAPAVLVALAPCVALAHPAGQCVAAAPAERCERWAVTYDDPSITSPDRSDQFTAAVLLSRDAVIVVNKDVAFSTADPYSSRATAVVVAYDRATGAVRWSAKRSERAYLSPHAAALSPDGSRLYVTGAAYDSFPVGAHDSWLSTWAYDTRDGSLLWSASWDGRPDGTDSPKGIAVSPDGHEVYVTGVTTQAGGDMDFVTLAYHSDGRDLWVSTYAGPKPGGLDSPFGLAVSPDGATLVVTGWSDAYPVEYDADYATVAYTLKHGKRGSVRWVARYDGIGAHKSDRAMAVAVDGERAYVTGDSWAGTTGSGYDYATVAYDLRSGAQEWDARWSGLRGGFNSPVAVIAAGGRVAVTGQSTAASSDDGNDAGTVAVDATTGARRWTASFGVARSDDLARGLAVSPDGTTAYVVTMDTPLVPYTALSRLSLVAYDMATGLVRWQTSLDPSPGDALKGAAVAADATGIAVAGDYQRSASPLGPEDQNVYDTVTALFAS